MKEIIRAMVKEDWSRVAAIYTQALEKGNATFQTECPSYEEWSGNHLMDCRYVIEVDGKVVGWCAISATSKRKAYEGVVEVSIYFDELYQHQGYGKKLLTYLCDEAREKGYWCLYVAIFSINKASIALHEKCGFRMIGYRERIAKDRFGNWQNTTLMEKRF